VTFAALWSIAPGKVARAYGGAYVFHISRRVVPSSFYMAFNPILRAQSGKLCSCDIRFIEADRMSPAATEPGEAFPLERHPTK
jgi:hypothetical protein